MTQPTPRWVAVLAERLGLPSAGGRDGAILGGAVGAATGTAITTKDQREDYYDHDRRRDDYDDHRSYRKSRGHFCPPGQAKKGNC